MSSSTPPKAAVLAAVLATALTTAACGQMDGKPKGNPLENIGGSKATEDTTIEKFNDYTEAFNGLIHDHWGVSKYYERYEQLGIPSKSIDASINFPENISHLERMLTLLKEGRALPGNEASAAADAAADQTIAAVEALLEQWKALTPYYEARDYRSDNLAKGKAAHEQLLAAYRSTLAAINKLDEALTIHQRQRNEAHAKALLAAGHEDQAVAVQTMQIADYFTTAALEENVPEADRLLVELDAKVTRLRAVASELPAEDRNKRLYDNIADYLTSAIGSWRDYRQNGRTSNLESLLRQYNYAIDRFDDVEFSA